MLLGRSVFPTEPQPASYRGCSCRKRSHRLRRNGRKKQTIRVGLAILGVGWFSGAHSSIPFVGLALASRSIQAIIPLDAFQYNQSNHKDPTPFDCSK